MSLGRPSIAARWFGLARVRRRCSRSACAMAAALAANFPALTGRIVDQANIIPAATRDAIEPKLADLEAKSGIQLVVATVSSLEGEEIEPYANELFRTWKLGEKDKNNGVLLLVAPNEQRVRIEVGYGLEGTLTDALSKVIIANAIAPRFKAGDFGGGISRGVDDIITVLTTNSSEWQQRPSLRLDNQNSSRSADVGADRGRDRLITLLIVSPGFRWFFFNVVAEHSRQFAFDAAVSGAARAAPAAAAPAAAFPAAAARRAAAELRGAGDDDSGIRTAPAYRLGHPRRRSPARRARSSACWRRRRPTPLLCRSCWPPRSRSRCRGCWSPSRRYPVNRILLLQATVFVILAVVLCLPRIRVALLPRAARRAAAHRAAMAQFSIRGIARKQDRSGILIFVSLAERYARIIADDGIVSRVPQAEWQEAVDALIVHMRDGRIADGFIAAIDACGTVLTAHFPRTETSRDELPDRIYLI